VQPPTARSLSESVEGGEDSHDHLIDPEDFINVAMAQQ
jgi:hypothetical protein